MSHVLEIMASQLACPFKAAPQTLGSISKVVYKGPMEHHICQNQQQYKRYRYGGWSILR